MGDRLLAMLLATSILILVPTPADAVTWRVERGGTTRPVGMHSDGGPTNGSWSTSVPWSISRRW